MYSKSGEIMDRREMLRVKVKSLADEARLIRREEQRTVGPLRDELQLHRREVVRHAARTSHMAYALIRGRPVDSIEKPRNQRSDSFWKAVRTMIEKYGPLDTTLKHKLLEQCVK